MNQQCKVCGEPAAGFHFGAFTCEGCKSFFGRSYNNLNSITECKNNGECIINKKNRTACKSCRLRKCLLVGMSKSGSRYGRRSNWFKIHCLLQEQQQAAVAQLRGKNSSSSPPEAPPIPLLSPLAFPHPNLGNFFRPDNPSSPSISSPDSDSSENGIYSPRINGVNPFASKDFYLPVPFHSMFVQSPQVTSPFLLPSPLFPFPVTAPVKPERRTSSPDRVRKSPSPDDDARTMRGSPRCSPLNNNDYNSKNQNGESENDGKCSHNRVDIMNNNNVEEDKVSAAQSKRFYLDAILGLHSPKSPGSDYSCHRSPRRYEEQDNPIDLSIKKISFEERQVTASRELCCREEEDEGKDVTNVKVEPGLVEVKPIPLDLSI